MIDKTIYYFSINSNLDISSIKEIKKYFITEETTLKLEIDNHIIDFEIQSVPGWRFYIDINYNYHFLIYQLDNYSEQIKSPNDNFKPLIMQVLSEFLINKIELI